jgi:hypothetical protein
MFARKSIGLQQNFVLAVMNHVGGEMLGFGMLAYVLVHGSNCTIFHWIWQKRGQPILMPGRIGKLVAVPQVGGLLHRGFL